jgi:predicted transcriptional regulator
MNKNYQNAIEYARKQARESTYEAVAASPGIAVNGVSIKTGFKWETVKKHLLALMREGRIVGVRKGYKWSYKTIASAPDE